MKWVHITECIWGGDIVECLVKLKSGKKKEHNITLSLRKEAFKILADHYLELRG